MNEEINKKLLDDLKNLYKVDAPKNFETELWRKINSSEETEQISFWDKIFTTGKIAPAAIAVVSAVIIFFVVNITPEQMEDPLNIQPRLRDDFVVIKTMNITPVELEKKSEVKKLNNTELSKGVVEKKDEVQPAEELNEQILSNTMDKKSLDRETFEELEAIVMDSDSHVTDETKSLGGNTAPVTSSGNSTEISRNSINFMQRSLSTAEKDQVKQLKMKVTTQKSAKTEENQIKATQK